MSPRDVLRDIGVRVHPAADDARPMMGDAELAALASDLAENGLQLPLVWIKQTGASSSWTVVAASSQLRAYPIENVETSLTEHWRRISSFSPPSLTRSNEWPA